MAPSQLPEDNENRKAHAVLQKMGMALAVLGTLIFSAGLAVCWQGSGETPDARCISMLAFGIALLAAGLYTWRNAKETD